MSGRTCELFCIHLLDFLLSQSFLSFFALHPLSQALPGGSKRGSGWGEGRAGIQLVYPVNLTPAVYGCDFHA